jgi:hypothetical protein
MTVARANLDIYRPLGGRTEKRVAAEVVARLLEAGLLTRTPVTIARSAAALGIPIGMIQEAWEHQKITVVPFDATLVMGGQDPPGSHMGAQTPQGRNRQQEHNRAQKAKKEPVPGMRLCAKCEELKPKSEYRVKVRKTGQLSSWCKACLKVYQQERWLSSERQKQLGDVLRFILGDDDAHAGAICPDCRLPCKPGEEVVASDAVIHHATHEADSDT